MKVIYESASKADADYIKSLLSDQKIEAVELDPRHSEIFPNLNFNEEIYLAVEDELATQAQTIVNSLKNS